MEHHGPDTTEPLCVGLSGNGLGGPSSALRVDVALHRLPLELPADRLSSWQVAYICSFVTFGETDNSRQVKGGFLCSRAKS